MGPEKVWVLQLRDGNIAKETDLTAAVRQQVLPDFKKSHAARYNEYYDFVFDEEREDTAGWKLDDQGHVIIDTMCTTDPKELDAHRWAVCFKGNRDIATGEFSTSHSRAFRRSLTSRSSEPLAAVMRKLRAER